MNCDGAVSDFGGKSGCGSVVRSNRETLSPCSVAEAELWAILKGLKLAKERGYDRIQVETDSLVALRLIQMDCSPLHPSFNLIREIKL